MAAKAIPEGYHSVTPYMIVDGAAEAIRWYGEAFGATEALRLPMGDKIGHAEIRIGDSFVMLADEWPDMGMLGPKARGGATMSLMIYVEDSDSAFAGKRSGFGAPHAGSCAFANSAMRRWISSSGTSSPWVETVQRWPNGSTRVPERSP